MRVGLGLREGQELVLTAPIEALPLVRRITDHAYRAGALLVTTFYSDDPCVLSRFEHAPDASFDYAPVWLQDAIATAFKNGAARMAIAGTNPALLGGQDPAKVARANVAASKAAKPAMELITRHEINWTIVAAATPEWAKLVFPGEPVDVAMAKLWEAIFQASRITGDDPVAGLAGAWRAAEAAGGHAECEAVCGAALQVEGWLDGSEGGAGGPASVGRRRDDRGQRRVLPAEHSDGGVLYDAA